MTSETQEHPSFARARAVDEPWRSHFPKSVEEAKAWLPYVQRHALSFRVLAVARTRVEGAWCAYIDAVPGLDHDAEQAEVLRHGTKLRESVALALFHEFTGVPYAR